MFQLNTEGLKNTAAWSKADVALPEFDVQKMITKTREHPTWVHFGAGNIFRGFIAALQQTLLNKGVAEKGIVAVETFDAEIIDKIYKPYDNLSLLILMEPNGNLQKSVIASVAESLVGDVTRETDWQRLREIAEDPSLQCVSFTITEKGYSLTNMAGDWLSDVAEDFAGGPDFPKHLMSKVAAFAYRRYRAGSLPIAFLSLDNCSHNGEKLANAVLTVAQHWLDNGIVDAGFLEYLKQPEKVAFPWSMIDKITPRPAELVKDKLTDLGLQNMDILCTGKKTFIAPFVNAEVPQYLVIEDHFPNGRMSLEKAGVLFADRETVENVERMKVTTCLNPLHTALAVFGCLLGHTSIADEMKDETLKNLVERIGHGEGMPVVVNPEIMNPEDFLNEVIEKRLPNPFIPDTPQRIASDTSQKMAIRFGETIKAYRDKQSLDARSLKYIPLVIAGWCRYLMGIDDNGETFQLSPDPMLKELTAAVAGIELGNAESAAGCLRPILSNEKLFGLNLYEAGLGEKIEGYFREFISGVHAVRRTLRKYLV